LKILAFDTSSTACSVAVLNGEALHVSHQIQPMQQARLILPMIDELLSAASLSLSQLDAIAYGCGPGSFTGIRIANSVAQGLGLATERPIIRISSLAAIAQTAYLAQHWAQLLVALDARTDQVYWAAYQANQQGYVELIGQELISSPAAVVLPPDMGLAWCGVGDGWGKYERQFTERLGKKPQTISAAQLPSAEAVLKLAMRKIEKGELGEVAARDAVPNYLRS
jgi:tRNA threonylcarbamoyladenosine biosynthesis protein TsaB